MFIILIILTSLFMLPVSNDKLSKHKPDNCTERVVKHIIKFKQSPSGEILRQFNKYGKSTTQDRRLDDVYPPENVSCKCSKWDEHKDITGYLLKPVVAVFMEKFVIFP